MLATKPRTFTADEFLAEFEGVPGRWELVGGQPRLMSGRSVAHANVAGNVYSALRRQLRGTGCRPFNSDMGFQINDGEVLYPDLAIYCSPRDRNRDPLKTKSFFHPSTVFEVLSPSTARYDREQKVASYQNILSVRLIVLIDPERSTFETYERADEGWTVGIHPQGTMLAVTDPAFQITADDMFADD